MKDNIELNNSLKRYIKLPLYIVILLVLIDSIFFITGNEVVAIICTVLTVVYAIYALVAYHRFKSTAVSELVDFARDFGQSQDESLKTMNVPYAMTSSDHVLWMNDSMQELAGDRAKVGSGLSEVFPKLREMIAEMGDEDEKDVDFEYEEHQYHMEVKRIRDAHSMPSYIRIVVGDASKYYGIYVFDRTELLTYKKESDDKTLVSGLIYVDNYDEIIEATDEVDQSYTAAMIDRRIAEYTRKYDGICKKMENDRYYVVFNKKSLREMEKDHFSISSSIRELGEELGIKPTISIGIGTGGATFQDSYRYSRIAIETAVTRGGDQAVVKEGADLRYYGGTSERDSKNNRVKARVKAEALRDLLISKDSIFIMGHKRFDVDCLGAAVGISCIVRSLGKKASIVLNEESTSVKPLMNRFRSDKEKNGHVFINSSMAMSLVERDSLVIVVDTNRPNMVECPRLAESCDSLVVIDHHRTSSDSFKSPALSYIESYASSTSEMVTELIRYVSDEIKLNPLEADSMYAGIMIDTTNFLTKTGVRTFEAAAFLRRNNADVSRVRKVFRDDIDSYQTKAETVRIAEVYKDHFAISIAPKSNIANPMIIGAQAANELLNIDSIRASFVFTQYKGTVYLSARSIDEVNVQTITEKLGGGGHMSIAGAQFDNMNVLEAKKKLTGVIDKMLEEGDL